MMSAAPRSTTPRRGNQINAPLLSDAAEIIPGFSTPGAIQHQPGGRFLIIQPKHIDESGRSVTFNDDHDTRMDLPERAASYCLHSGDVLFMSRGEKNRAAMVRDCTSNAVPTVAFFVLRSRPGVADPAYLAWYLNQAPAQTAIVSVRTGAGTPMVQRSLFEALRIPLPPLAIQRQIARISELQQREQDLMQRLAQSVAIRNRGAGIALINNLP